MKRNVCKLVLIYQGFEWQPVSIWDHCSCQNDTPQNLGIEIIL